jgi:hypothetical protein
MWSNCTVQAASTAAIWAFVVHLEHGHRLLFHAVLFGKALHRACHPRPGPDQLLRFPIQLGSVLLQQPPLLLDGLDDLRIPPDAIRMNEDPRVTRATASAHISVSLTRLSSIINRAAISEKDRSTWC